MSRLAAVLSAAVLIALTGCAGPTIRDEAIANQAEKSASAMVSALRTIDVATKTQLDAHSWWQYADVVITDAEDTATSVESTFTSRTPPSPASRPLYDETSAQLSDAVDLVTDMRIAVRHQDADQIESLRPRLAKAADDLERLEQKARKA